MKKFIERKRDYAIEFTRSIDHETYTQVNNSNYVDVESDTKFSPVNSADYIILKLLTQTNSVSEIYDDIQRLRSNKMIKK